MLLRNRVGVDDVASVIYNKEAGREVLNNRLDLAIGPAESERWFYGYWPPSLSAPSPGVITPRLISAPATKVGAVGICSGITDVEAIPEAVLGTAASLRKVSVSQG